MQWQITQVSSAILQISLILLNVELQSDTRKGAFSGGFPLEPNRNAIVKLSRLFGSPLGHKIENECNDRR
jgi:hypothetical protein